MKRKEIFLWWQQVQRIISVQNVTQHKDVKYTIRISFVEALKLNLALDECIRRLNKLNFVTKEGKEAAVNLVVNFHNERITISDWSGESK